VQQTEGLPVKLVVIDSLAGLFRGRDDATEMKEFYEEGRVFKVDVPKPTGAQMMEQSAALFKLAMELKAVSDVYKIVFMVANQVSDFKSDFGKYVDWQLANLAPGLTGHSPTIDSPKQRAQKALKQVEGKLHPP